VIILCPGFIRTVPGGGVRSGAGYATISCFSEVETILPDRTGSRFSASC